MLRLSNNNGLYRLLRNARVLCISFNTTDNETKRYLNWNTLLADNDGTDRYLYFEYQQIQQQGLPYAGSQTTIQNKWIVHNPYCQLSVTDQVTLQQDEHPTKLSQQPV